jgi:hypothetical protein
MRLMQEWMRDRVLYSNSVPMMQLVLVTPFVMVGCCQTVARSGGPKQDLRHLLAPRVAQASASLPHTANLVKLVQSPHHSHRSVLLWF